MVYLERNEIAGGAPASGRCVMTSTDTSTEPDGVVARMVLCPKRDYARIAAIAQDAQSAESL